MLVAGLVVWDSGRAQARGGVHRHVAEDTASPLQNPPRYAGQPSPLFNRPDGAWNLGEGFPATGHVDGGGYLGPDDGSDLALGDIRTSLGWHLYTAPNGATLHRFVGYLYPEELSDPPAVEDAAFELWASNHTGPPIDPFVAISTWSTTGFRGPGLGGRFAYPGHPLIHGLWPGTPPPDGDGVRRPACLPYRLAEDGPLRGFRVLGGYIVPRTAGRPMVFQMQRNLQLVKAIRKMLAEPLTSPLHPPGFPVVPEEGDGVPVLIAGTSFGGIVSQLSVLYHPTVFHGAFDGSLSASLRRTIAEHESWRYVTTRCGFGGDDSTYDLRDAVEWPAYVRQLGPAPGRDFFDACFTRRFVDGLVERPAAFWIADEDTVTCGNDWVPLLSGQRKYVEHFSRTVANSDVFLSIVDRRCHQGGFFTSPFPPHATTTDPHDLILDLMPFVAASHAINPSPPAPPLLADDGSEDPHDHALTRTWQTPVPTSGELVLDTSFGNGGRTAGQGVALGNDESLRVGEDDSVYVGSADGVVTRFVVNGDTPSTKELDVAAQSQVLGYSASALDVGEVDPANPQREVAVGTYRHVWLLDAATLTVIRQRALPYEHSRPRRMQIVDLFPGNPGNEIVFSTMYGHLVVLDEQLQVVSDYPEPGIQDLIAHPTLTNGASETASKVMVTLMSHRGHIANVTLDAVPDPTQHTARLQAWTDPLLGEPVDIEVYEAGAQKRIAALFSHNETAFNKTIRLFDALTLTPVAELPTDIGAQNHPQRVLDLAVTEDSNQDVHFVVINPPDIFLVDKNGTTVGQKRLGTFAPALNPLAVAVADIWDGDTSDQFTAEVILATESGQVVWFEVEAIVDLLDEDLGLPRVEGNNLPYTNRTLAATWGMVSRDVCNFLICGGTLQVVDQTGTRWSVCPISGQATFLHEIRVEHATDPGEEGEPLFPIRDLVALAADLQGENVMDSGLTFWHPPLQRGSSQTPGNKGFFETRPWQNELHFLAPKWETNNPPLTNPPELYAYRHVDTDYIAFPSGGDALANGDPVTGAIGQAHWWGGQRDTYPNLVQGMFFDTTQITQWWSSSVNEPAGESGRAPGDNKDLRNILRETGTSIFNVGSLRVVEDGAGPLIVASTSGGSVVLIRPGDDPDDHGTIVWDSEDGLVGSQDNVDYGYGGMGLAVRPTPTQPGQVDVFLGVAFHHADPAPHAPPVTGPGDLVGAVAWLKWDPNAGEMTEEARIVLDPNPVPDPAERGGYAVCGLAVGDLLIDPENPGGDELVVTTLDGDLFVYTLDTGLGPTLVYRTWVEGSIGAYNSIVIDDLDLDGKNELYVAGSMGIRKYFQPGP